MVARLGAHIGAPLQSDGYLTDAPLRTIRDLLTGQLAIQIIVIDGLVTVDGVIIPVGFAAIRPTDENGNDTIIDSGGSDTIYGGSDNPGFGFVLDDGNRSHY